MSKTTTRYIDPLMDFGFKKIFGSEPNKDLLISFLNQIFKGRKHIVDLVYNKTEHHGDNKEEASAVFDLLCTGDQGEKFLIEIQHSNPVNFKKRGLYYTSRLISEQAPKGKSKTWKYKISEVYFIAILDKMEEGGTDSDRYLHDICLCYRDTGEIFYDNLGYTYIDLSKFVKTEAELTSDLDVWLYLLKHLDEQDDMPRHLRKTIFEKLYKIAEYTNLSKEEQQMYDQDLKRKWDNEAVKAFREEQQEKLEQQQKEVEHKQKQIEQKQQQVEQKERQAEQMIKQAEQKVEQAEQKVEQAEQKVEQAEQKAEQAEHHKAVEIALKLKEKGTSDSDIADLTGLTIKEIENI